MAQNDLETRHLETLDRDLGRFSYLENAASYVSRPLFRAGYVVVDYGPQLRRDHAVLFARENPSAITLASARWAIDYLSRTGGSAYLPERHTRHFSPWGRVVPDAPVLEQTIALVENTSVTRQWPWLDEALAGLGA